MKERLTEAEANVSSGMLKRLIEKLGFMIPRKVETKLKKKAGQQTEEKKISFSWKIRF